MVILAVDLGKARTGVAICDKGEMLASPIGTITDRSLERVADKIAEYAVQRKAERLVVGLPKNMDGTEGKCGLPVDMQDERGTTITAHSFLNATDTRGKKRKQAVDTLSATIILEDYLNKRKNQRI